METKRERRRHLKFKPNFYSNLLEREIGRDEVKNKPIRNSYHHSYQLLASLYPDHLEQVNLNYCEPPNADFPSLDSDADCLGFSPDGRYLAFHSHGHSAITVLRYYGVEESKNDKSHPMCCFDETTKVDLGVITRDYHYNNEKATRSWWTDDSTTIILQFNLEDYEDEEEEHDEPEEDVYVEIDDITAEIRGLESLRNVPNPIVWDRAAGEYPYDQLDAGEPGEEMPQDDRNRDIEIDHENPPGIVQKNNVRVYYEQESSGIYEKDEFEFEDSPKDSYHRETSRTMPYYSSVEAAAQISADEERVRRETSRTMPVYHSLISSADPKSGESEVEIPSTSNFHRRVRNTNPIREEEPQTKRQKDNSIPLIEHSRKDLESAEKSKYGSRSVREVVHKLKTCPEYARNLKLKGSNPSGLGYTRREAGVTSVCRNKKHAYSDRLRDIFDFLSGFDNSDSVDKIDGVETTILFLAYNVETEVISILNFEKIIGSFEYHARNSLIVVSIEDSIQAYNLSEERNCFVCLANFRFSLKDTETLQLKFHTGTMPGLPSERLEEQAGSVIGELYDKASFLTPLQQNVATLFHRDALEFFLKNNILTEKPMVKRLTCIEHRLLAITLSYSTNFSIRIGVIVSMIDFSVIVYPDYHEFLKLLFTHHLPDLLPGHWNVGNPSPVIDQLWFKNEIIDFSKAEDLSDLTRLNNIYEFLHKTWHIPKTTSNPLQSSVFNQTHAYQLYCNYLFSNDGKISFKDLHVKNGIHMEQYFHPNDPLKVIKSNDCWYYAFRDRDSQDIIVNID